MSPQAGSRSGNSWPRCPSAEIVAECGDGAAAVEAILRHAPDVLFLDVGLGGVSGLDVLERVGRRGAGDRVHHRV